MKLVPSLNIKEGRYVVAVSGGVDSVVLLDMLAKRPNLSLVVAHFDHGIRDDSKEDRQLVATLSQKYHLPFEYAEGKLGKNTSEEKARTARYDFLQKIRKKYNADAIITAHHQDDLIETMFINVLRGTKHKGLASLKSNDDLERPLLNLTKQDLLDYAKENNLVWREDSTNRDTNYLRNWLRLKIIPKLTKAQREQLLEIYDVSKKGGQEIAEILKELGVRQPKINKSLLTGLPHKVSNEYVAEWLRANGYRDFDTKQVERITLGIKTLSSGKKIPLTKGADVVVGKKDAEIVRRSIA